MRLRVHPLVVPGVLAVPTAAALAYLIYTCHALVTGAAVVLDTISRSL